MLLLKQSKGIYTMIRLSVAQMAVVEELEREAAQNLGSVDFVTVESQDEDIVDFLFHNKILVRVAGRPRAETRFRVDRSRVLSHDSAELEAQSQQIKVGIAVKLEQLDRALARRNRKQTTEQEQAA